MITSCVLIKPTSGPLKSEKGHTTLKIQWNPVDTVTNGPKKIGCINRVAILLGQDQISRLEGRNDKYTVHCIHRTVLINKQPECRYGVQ